MAEGAPSLAKVLDGMLATPATDSFARVTLSSERESLELSMDGKLLRQLAARMGGLDLDVFVHVGVNASQQPTSLEVESKPGPLRLRSTTADRSALAVAAEVHRTAHRMAQEQRERDPRASAKPVRSV